MLCFISILYFIGYVRYKWIFAKFLFYFFITRWSDFTLPNLNMLNGEFIAMIYMTLFKIYNPSVEKKQFDSQIELDWAALARGTFSALQIAENALKEAKSFLS